MAISATDQQRIDLEKKAVKEATDKYNDLIATLILISTSNKSKREKIVLINEQRTKMKSFNQEFSDQQTDIFYNKFSDNAFEEASDLINIDFSKKKLSAGQLQESQNLSDQLKLGLNKRLDVIIDQANQLTLKEELANIREKKLGMTDGSDRIQITPTKSQPNLVFTNVKGQVVAMDTVMKLTVGDQLWATTTSSQRAQWLLMGFRYATHISVLDNNTTPLCRALNGTKRDLTKDQLPPMHIACRSKIKLTKEGWSAEIFAQNYEKQ